ERAGPGKELAGDLGDEVRDVGVALGLEELADADGARLAHAREIVAAQVDEHDVLRPVLLGGEKLFRVSLARAGRPGNRVQARPRSLQLHEGPGGQADVPDSVKDYQ